MSAPTFTPAEFRERIARIMNGGLMPVKASHPSLVGQPTDRGYYPPQIERELDRLIVRYHLTDGEHRTAREKALSIWKVGRR